jgi:hypothetical protein
LPYVCSTELDRLDQQQQYGDDEIAAQRTHPGPQAGRPDDRFSLDGIRDAAAEAKAEG